MRHPNCYCSTEPAGPRRGFIDARDHPPGLVPIITSIPDAARERQYRERMRDEAAVMRLRMSAYTFPVRQPPDRLFVPTLT